MLQPNKDRVDYGEMLIPPTGYVLDQAIATTYSLDLDTLISIPVALYFAHSLDVDFKADMVQVLEAIRRASTSVKVFCQKGQIAVPGNQHKLYGFVEDCIVQVPYTPNHSFHPKVWVLRYKNEQEHIVYRCIVLSRNLTFDRSWDVAFSIDGELQRANNRKAKPLVDFLQWVTSHDTEENGAYTTFLEDLAKVKFELGEGTPFDDFQFFPIGLDKYPGSDVFDKSYDELLILSPFLSPNAVDTAIRHSKSKVRLFSRETELQRMNPETIEQIEAWHLVTDYVEGESKFDTDAAPEVGYQRQDLHAKVYVYKEGWNAEMLLGSANLTNRALYHNIEFMIRLMGKYSKIGTSVVFGELVNDDMAVFQQFKAEHTGISAVAEELLQVEEEMRKLKVALTNVTIQAQAEADSGNYTVNVQIDCQEVSWSKDIIVSTHLFNHSSQKAELTPLHSNELSVQNCAETDISVLLIVNMLHKKLKVQSSFALKIHISNLPLSRNTKIFNQIISNSQNFFKYLQFLLEDNYWDNHGFEPPEGPGYRLGNGQNGHFDLEQPLYEQLLLAISRTPRKLKDIQEVIDKIEEEQQEDTPIIPEHFKQLWSVFKTVLPRQLRRAAV